MGYCCQMPGLLLMAVKIILTVAESRHENNAAKIVNVRVISTQQYCMNGITMPYRIITGTSDAKRFFCF